MGEWEDGDGGGAGGGDMGELAIGWGELEGDGASDKGIEDVADRVDWGLINGMLDGTCG